MQFKAEPFSKTLKIVFSEKKVKTGHNLVLLLMAWLHLLCKNSLDKMSNMKGHCSLMISLIATAASLMASEDGSH